MHSPALPWRPLSPSLCLHAPGLPDRLFADGRHLGWQDAGGLYVCHRLGPAAGGEGALSFLPLPGVRDLAVSGPDRWVAVTEAAVCWGAPGQPWQQRTLSAGRWRAGGAWLLGRLGLEHRAETLEGAPISSPMLASRALPLPDQAGLVWAGGTALYHQDGEGRVRVLDALPSGCVSLLPGPGESLLVETREGGVLASTSGRLLVALREATTLEGARIAANGRRALLATDTGTGLFDLRTGALLDRWPAVSPVGFLAQAPDGVLLLDDAQGHVQDTAGRVWHAGFLPAAPLRVERRLYGPGGAAWDLETGERLFENPALSAEALLYDDESGEALLFALQEEVVVILDAETGEDLGEEPREDEGGELSSAEADLLSEEDAAALGEGLPIDSGVEVGGRWWLWSDEGLLLSRPTRTP